MPEKFWQFPLTVGPLTVVPSDSCILAISEVNISVLFLAKNGCHRASISLGGGGWNAIWQNSGWRCIFVYLMLPTNSPGFTLTVTRQWTARWKRCELTKIWFLVKSNIVVISETGDSAWTTFSSLAPANNVFLSLSLLKMRLSKLYSSM